MIATQIKTNCEKESRNEKEEIVIYSCELCVISSRNYVMQLKWNLRTSIRIITATNAVSEKCNREKATNRRFCRQKAQKVETRKRKKNWAKNFRLKNKFSLRKIRICHTESFAWWESHTDKRNILSMQCVCRICFLSHAHSISVPVWVHSASGSFVFFNLTTTFNEGQHKTMSTPPTVPSTTWNAKSVHLILVVDAKSECYRQNEKCIAIVMLLMSLDSKHCMSMLWKDKSYHQL